MTPLLAVVLICVAGVAPAECSRDTAVDVVIQPAALPTACMLAGEAMAARLALAPGQYPKIACERRRS